MPTPTPLCPPWLGESFKYLRAHPHTLKPKCTEIRWPTLDPSGPSRRGRARKTIQVACEARLVPPRTSLLLPGPDLSSGAPALRGRCRHSLSVAGVRVGVCGGGEDISSFQSLPVCGLLSPSTRVFWVCVSVEGPEMLLLLVVSRGRKTELGPELSAATPVVC